MVTSSSDDGSSDDDGSSSTTGLAGCAIGLDLCDGICVDIDIDKHACGIACIDCTEIYGNDARCVDGECEPHDDHGDDDD
jgi:hypothetical protein